MEIAEFSSQQKPFIKGNYLCSALQIFNISLKVDAKENLLYMLAISFQASLKNFQIFCQQS